MHSMFQVYCIRIPLSPNNSYYQSCNKECCMSLSLRLKSFWQTLHWCGFSFVWTKECLLRWYLSLNILLQTSHLCCFIWLYCGECGTQPQQLRGVLHNLQSGAVSPECTDKCLTRWYLSRNLLLQNTHSCWASFLLFAEDVWDTELSSFTLSFLPYFWLPDSKMCFIFLFLFSWGSGLCEISHGNNVPLAFLYPLLSLFCLLSSALCVSGTSDCHSEPSESVHEEKSAFTSMFSADL